MMWKKPSLWITIGVLGLLLVVAVFYPQSRPATKAADETSPPESRL